MELINYYDEEYKGTQTTKHIEACLKINRILPADPGGRAEGNLSTEAYWCV